MYQYISVIIVGEKKDYAPFYHVFLEFDSTDGDGMLTEEQKNKVTATKVQKQAYLSFLMDLIQMTNSKLIILSI